MPSKGSSEKGINLLKRHNSMFIVDSINDFNCLLICAIFLLILSQ